MVVVLAAVMAMVFIEKVAVSIGARSFQWRRRYL
jgi:hypothetical protein